MTEGAIIDWVGGLADDTWRHVAGYLGLSALSLRATCSTLHERVLALKELPAAIQLARRVLPEMRELLQRLCPLLEALAAVRSRVRPGARRRPLREHRRRLDRAAHYAARAAPPHRCM